MYVLSTTEPIALPYFDDTEAGITIDGNLDEAVWAQVPAFDEFRVLRPDTLLHPTYGTRVRIFYTRKGLYFAYDLYQPPATIVKRYTVRDTLSVNRDYLSLTLDTSGDGRYGFWMNLALGDNQIDGTILPERRYSREWDGAWYGATRETDAGWTAELLVPWSQLAMPKSGEQRRIGFYTSRRVAHLNEVWGWPTLPRTRPRFMSDFQPMQVSAVDPRHQWSVFPYVSYTHDRAQNEDRQKAGIDLRWQPVTGFRTTATINPDFGSVESDDVIVNLTADETFFPEKRLFFQEGQEIFNTSSRSDPNNEQALIVVNTRRIGARPRPPPLPPGVALPERETLEPSSILAAVKATGQAGSIRYGVLGAWEDASDFTVGDATVTQDGGTFGAVRILYENSSGAAYRGLGLISTVVAHPQGDASTHGIDARYLSAAGRWKFEGQLLHSNRDEEPDGYGAFADITYAPRQGLKHSLALTALDEHLNINDFGFQVRNDFIEAWYRMEWQRSDLNLVRDFTVAPGIRYQENGDGFQTDVSVGIDFNANLNNLDRVTIAATHMPEQFDDRNSFGNGVFETAARERVNIQYRTNTAKRASFFGGFEYSGELAGGHSTELEGGVVWRARDNLIVDFRVAHKRRDGWLLHQQDRNFTAFDATQNQLRATFEYFPSAKHQFRMDLQWAGVRALEDSFYAIEPDGTALVPVPKPPGPTDDFSLSLLNFQFRYRWEIAPLSDLFIVYTKSDDRSGELRDFSSLFRDSWNDPLQDQLVVKLRYRFGVI